MYVCMYVCMSSSILYTSPCFFFLWLLCVCLSSRCLRILFSVSVSPPYVSVSLTPVSHITASSSSLSQSFRLPRPLHRFASIIHSARRKPAVLARVTVDGTTKSGQPATRSHHPVWFPAQPSGDNAESRSSNSHRRQDGSSSRTLGGSSSSSGSVIGRNGGSSARVFGRASSRLEDTDAAAGTLDRTRGRFRGGSGSGGGNSRGGGSGPLAGIAGGGGGVGVGNGGCDAVDGGRNVARGLLFEVREFYGPTRVVVELVSGGGGGGGNSGGRAVLGRCEARLAEALVGRGGGSGSGSSSLAKTAPGFGLGKGE